MNQVEPRPLRHFVAVAQELSFARASECLRISPRALSRTVAQLEAQLGAAGDPAEPIDRAARPAVI
jgi:DNA-binding transcriptional LysR family regulator